MEDKRKSPSSLFADIESEKKKKKKKLSSSSGSSNHEVAAAASSNYVADDILRFEILPRLSFKTLSRFMIVSKSWRALISNDPLFALDQSRHPSPISSSFVYLSLRGLEFLQLPNTPVGVPDPSLSMLQYSDRVGLVASTNGLLCLCAHGNILYLVNPATEKPPERIPCRRSWKRHCWVGLAFDPSVSATHYTLVYPHHSPWPPSPPLPSPAPPSTYPSPLGPSFLSGSDATSGTVSFPPWHGAREGRAPRLRSGEETGPRGRRWEVVPGREVKETRAGREGWGAVPGRKEERGGCWRGEKRRRGLEGWGGGGAWEGMGGGEGGAKGSLGFFLNLGGVLSNLNSANRNSRCSAGMLRRKSLPV